MSRPVTLLGASLWGVLFAAMPLADPSGLDSQETVPSAHQRWAVVIGIDDYVHFDAAPRGDLRGATNDARSFSDVLIQRWGFEPDQVLLLLDRDATRAAIEQAVTGWLASRVAPGDVALFFYSGHGSQAIDSEGDEPDGLDETIAPVDVLPNSADLDITDDMLRSWLGALSTERTIAIFDSCHSGTASRFQSAQVIPRFLPRERFSATAATRGAPTPDGGLIGTSVMLEMAAAAPSQVAVEAEFFSAETGARFYGGAFTTHLVRQLWRARPSADYRSLFAALTDAMKVDRFMQDPQIEGLDDFALFDLTGEEAVRLASGEVGFSHADGGEIVLSAGARRGVSLGSLYETAGAIFRIEAVGADEATARVVSGSPPTAGLARLLAHGSPDPVLGLDTRGLGPSLRPAVSTRLAGSPLVRIVDGDAADLFLWSEGETVAVRARDGALRSSMTGNGSALVDAVVQALAREAALARLVAMDNPLQPFAVDLALVGETNRFRRNDRIGFRVSSARAGYLTLIDLGTDGTVTVLFPNRFVPDGRIEADREFTIPTEHGPFALSVSGPVGWGTVRALVTPAPLDLPVSDEAFLSRRDGEVLAKVLVRELHETLSGLWDLSVPLEGAVPVSQWGTSITTYRVIQ